MKKRSWLRTVALTAALAANAAAQELTWIGPRQQPERARALRRNGGTGATEKAVEAGLAWLARHQSAAGGWDADGFAARCEEGAEPCTGPGKGQHGEEIPCPFDTAISALATLAFLGHGHLPAAADDPYADTVARALAALEQGGGPWALALTTQAFAEAEAMERAGRYRERVRTRVDALLARRQEDGAWGYVAPARPGSDVPYTALVVQALLAARDAGAELPADLGTGVSAWLDTLEESKGRLAYLVDGRRYGYTPTTTNGHLAAALRAMLGTDTRGERHRAHLALVERTLPEWKLTFETVEVPGRGPLEVQVGNLSLYQWWYGTLATFHTSPAAWRQWFGRLKGELTGAQVTAGCARGSWNPEGTYERQTGGRVMATALAVLMLEQPYRQLPAR